MVHEVKFTRWRRLGDELGRLLGDALREAVIDAGVREQRVVLVPVPSSLWRRLGRGIDHATVIARGVAGKTGYPVAAALRRKHRPSQLSVPAGRRAANVAGSFASRRGWDLAGRHVVVIDDVTTTRATLAAACRALNPICKPLSGKDSAQPVTTLWCAVLGVTPHVGERPPGFAGGRHTE
jgi:predicted amidophosphoribosyltransferase